MKKVRIPPNFGRRGKMHRQSAFLAGLLSLWIPIFTRAQTGFNPQTYFQFLDANRDLSAEAMLERYGPRQAYYKGFLPESPLSEFAYLDSIALKYGLTADERELLRVNRFVVTERLRFGSFGEAIFDVFQKDLPVFLSADAVLHALHCSFDRILCDVELQEIGRAHV